LSAQEMCFCASQDGCQGGDLNTPWQYLADQGLSVGGKSIKVGIFFLFVSLSHKYHL